MRWADDEAALAELISAPSQTLDGTFASVDRAARGEGEDAFGRVSFAAPLDRP